MKTMRQLVDEYNKLILTYFPERQQIKKFKSVAYGVERLKKLNTEINNLPIMPSSEDLTPTRGNKDVIQTTPTLDRTSANKMGIVLYWTGTPCERGHYSPRYTKSGHCKQCYQLFRAEEISQKEISKDPYPKKEKEVENEEI